MPASLSALNRGRRAAEADMRDACRITGEPSGEKEWSDELLAYVDAEASVIYEGKCKLTFGTVETRESQAADQIFAEQIGKLSLPVIAPADAIGDPAAVARGHALAVLSSATDPDMAGAVFKIGARRLRSNPTSRRFQLEDTQ
ncbi:DUF6093 family protein [Microbacterium paludicola]|uniref:DUF6093 family protein n=1 Tax=Microbacterium paludicola TaxID=300019 RepID=UPI0011A8E880|nr:DUF6093 family protein [Microbacterium paludicola]